VFNVEQIEGLPQSLPFDVIPFDPIESAQRIQDTYLSAAGAPSFRHGGDSAFYSPSDDRIVLPHPQAFAKREGYYATFFHEAGHSTGHASRLDRKDGMHNIFGSHLYSKEELIAEFTSAFLCAECGISNEYTEHQSVAYLQSWIRVFKDDKTIAVSAAQRAQKACDLILGRGAAAAAESEVEAVAA
jgi:antirestriction protein ArdC